MKKFILLLSLIYCRCAFANMASPILPGTIGSSPFTSEFVDILGERILLKLDNSFVTAKYTIEYRIYCSKNGEQIPLLFYALDYQDDFRVWLDGRELQIKNIPEGLALADSIFYPDFAYFKNDSLYNNYNQLVFPEDSINNFYVDLRDLKYFNANISEGEHVVTVEYKAFCWQDGWDWVNKYSFRYALTPAKFWKSFGNLELTIDASDFDGIPTINLPHPFSGSLDSVATWKFDRLPSDILLLEYVPEIPHYIQVFISIHPFGIALIFSLLLVVLHVYLIIRTRNKQLEKRFSPVMIIGSLFVPVLFISIYIASYDFIDYLIGPGASGRHGYVFLSIFIYPFITPPYWIIMWLTDRIYRRIKIKKQKANNN